MDSRDPNNDASQATTAQTKPRGWYRRHPIVTSLLILILLLVAALWIIHDQIERAFAQRIAAIRARGEPVTIQDLIVQKKNIPDEENMAVVVLAAARKLGSVKLTDEENKLLPYQGLAFTTPTGEQWSDPTLQASQRYLSRINPALRELHEAMKLEQSYYIANWTTPAIDIRMPELSDMRQAAKALMLEVQTAAHLHDRENVELFIREMMPLTHALDGDTTLIAALVQIAVITNLHDTIERVTNLTGLPDDSLRDIQAALRDAELHPDLAKAFRIERVLSLNTMQWIHSIASWDFHYAFYALDISASLDFYAAMIEVLSEKNMSAAEGLNAWKAQAPPERWYSVYTDIIIPSTTRSIVLWLRMIGSNRALRTAIAAERFRLANGHWPEKLDVLVPAYLDAVPLDPIDGKPIRYAIIPEGIKTWTI
jgi:hypothetical protein